MIIIESYKKSCREFYTKLKAKCSECDGTGYKTNGRMYVDCKCTKIYMRLKEYLKAGVSLKYLLNDCKKESEIFTEDCLKKVDIFTNIICSSKQSHPNYFIGLDTTSSHGTSTIANKMIKQFINTGISTIVIKSVDLLSGLSNFDTHDELFKILDEYDIVIIDSFGEEYSKYLKDNTSYQHNRLMSFLTHRNGTSKKTFICGDLTMEKVRASYSDELFNYIFSQCLKFEVETKTRKTTVLDDLKQNNPELSSIFTDKKISNESKPVSTKSNRGRTLR